MATIISDRLNDYLDDFHNTLDANTNITTITTTITSWRPKVMLCIQLLLPILSESLVFSFLLKLTTTTLALINVLKTRLTSVSASLGSTNDDVVSHSIGLFIAVIGYVLIHHASIESLFNTSGSNSSTSSSNSSDAIADLRVNLILLFSSSDINAEAFVPLSSIVAGLRAYVMPILLIKRTATLNMPINKSFCFELSNIDLSRLVQKSYGSNNNTLLNINKTNTTTKVFE